LPVSLNEGYNTCGIYRKKRSMEDFEMYRPLLFSIAYRMTGSASEAEDIVQESYS
jgi:DNA-directed RNA polymerase specialized sigma24 family protein